VLRDRGSTVGGEAVDRHRLGGGDAGEALVDARAVEVGSPDRAGVEVRPVDAGAVDPTPRTRLLPLGIRAPEMKSLGRRCRPVWHAPTVPEWLAQ
jgi:hypothetical protein